MKTKSINPTGVKIVDEAEGKVSCVFAVFGVKDHDGDVTLPGAFEDGAKIRVSAYNHASWEPGHLPVGKGVIRTTDTEAIADLQFFMGTTAGRDTFEVMKEMDADLQEWSYGFDTLDSERGHQDGEPVNFLKKQLVHEVSPVILGAGSSTRTLSAKARKARNLGQWVESAIHRDFTILTDNLAANGHLTRDERITLSGGIGEALGAFVAFVQAEAPQLYERDPMSDAEAAKLADPGNTSLKFIEHIDTVLADVEELTTRAAEVMAMRQEKGKSLGEDAKASLDRLEPALKTLDQVLNPVEADTANQAALVEFERSRQLLRR